MPMPTSDYSWTWKCENTFPSDTRICRRVLDDLLRRLEFDNWTQRDIFCVHLAVYEALINAIVHGNHEDANKQVHFFCGLTPETVHVEIGDEGPGFLPEELPNPTDDEFLERPCGRGVLLMRAFM